MDINEILNDAGYSTTISGYKAVLKAIATSPGQALDRKERKMCGLIEQKKPRLFYYEETCEGLFRSLKMKYLGLLTLIDSIMMEKLSSYN